MKTFVVLAVSIVLVSIFFCPIAMAAPPMPNDVQMVEPDSKLPKELAGFWGKWEGNSLLGGKSIEVFLIVEKIDEEKAILYSWRSDLGWNRNEVNVTNERGKYKLWYSGRIGQHELTLSGKYLDWYLRPIGTIRLRRVP